MRVALFVLLAGCSSAQIRNVDAGRDAGHDAGRRDAGPRIYALTADPVELFPRGGPGGLPFMTDCLEGQVMVGLDVWMEDPDAGLGYVFAHALAPQCAHLAPDGTTGAAARGPMTGDIVGYTLYSDTCPTGSAVVGLHTSVSDLMTATPLVSEMGIICAPLPSWVPAGDGAAPLPPHGAAFPPMVFDDECAPGWVLVGLHGHSGGSIDSVVALCRQVIAG